MKKNILIINILLLNITGIFGAQATSLDDKNDDLQFLADVETIEAQRINPEDKKKLKDFSQKGVGKREASALKSLSQCSYCVRTFSKKDSAGQRRWRHVKKNDPDNLYFQCPLCEEKYNPAK